jgi:MtN3 and saliva related transmembrane protein
MFNHRVVMEDLVVWIGTIAGILVLLSLVPQIMKAYKTKRMVDVSSYLMILIANGMFLWVVYGVIRSDPVIMGTNATGFALNITLLIMKLKFDLSNFKFIRSFRRIQTQFSDGP